MNRKYKHRVFGLCLPFLMLAGGTAFASSHMDAPLITLDPAANTTDVYAFVSQRTNSTGIATTSTNGIGTNMLKYLTVALSVYPFEEPGIGPNNFRFDDNVLYIIYLINNTNDLAHGRADIAYRFRFTTEYRNPKTILQAFLGVVNDVGDTNQNLIQTYTVNRVDLASGSTTFLGTGIVPPNNQGNATPFYNQEDNGENPAKGGVATADQLDRYTAEAIATNLNNGYFAFAGQRDDDFYADVQAIFDLLKIRNPGVDSQAGFNVHTMVLDIPVDDIGGDLQEVGVYASTSRRQISMLRDGPNSSTSSLISGGFVQVARQGNPLFNEVLVALADKDFYNRTGPTVDRQVFAKYALNPEPARLLNTLVFQTPVAGIESNRTDIEAIFIPDVIKVDLSTAPARLAGGGDGNPNDTGYNRLGLLGGDTLVSAIQPGFGNGVVPGGWPNGRRFGDDVVDIALTALVSDLRTTPPTIRGPIGDNVDGNDLPYNKVFPYATTPHNGRNHVHSQ